MVNVVLFAKTSIEVHEEPVPRTKRNPSQCSVGKIGICVEC